MAFSTGNSQFDNLMRRARSSRRSADALTQNNIDVETIDESNQAQGDEPIKNFNLVSDISDLRTESGVSASDRYRDTPEFENVGVSQSISDANEITDIAGAGYGNPTAGQIAFDKAKQKGEDEFIKNDPIGAAIAGYYASATQQAILNLAPAALAYSGQIVAAQAVGNISSLLSGPASILFQLKGPSMDTPYGDGSAMGSGMLNSVSSSVMSTHYDVADKMAQGLKGYDQGYFNGNLVSMQPGFEFMGINFGPSLTGGSSGLSGNTFKEAMSRERSRIDDLTEEGGGQYKNNRTPGYGLDVRGFTSPQAAMEKGGITADAFGSSTEAARAGIGYSSYDASGNPSGAAPTGSQYSRTGTFSTDSNEDNSPSQPDTSSMNDSFNFKQGGKVPKKMAEGDAVTQNPEIVQGAGFIDQDRGATPQEEIKDDKPLEAEEGDFIINAPAAEFMGKQDVEEMISVAITNLQEKGVEIQFGNPEMNVKDNVQLLVSKNEVYIPKAIAEEIGYDKLEKINNRGKKEVSRRQQEAEQPQNIAPQQGLAEGGFIGMAEGDIVERDTVKSPEDEISELDNRVNELNEQINEITTLRDKNIDSNPQTPFSKYASKEDPNPTKLQGYKSGVEFGDIEQGMDLLNQTSWNKLLQAGLRDERSLSDFVNQLKKGKGFEGDMGHASGYYSPRRNKIALDGKGDDYLSKSLMAHELMHKGADTLSKDPNYSFKLPSANSSSVGLENLEDKPETAEGKAEHRYIQAVVNQAFLNSMVTDGVNYTTNLKKLIINEMVKDGSLRKGEDYSDNEQDIQKYGNSVLTKEIERVFNYYMTPQNRSDFEEKIKNEMGLESIVSVVSGEDKAYYQIDPALAGVLDPSEIKKMFQISNDVMAQDFETMLFKKQQYKAADRSSRTFKGNPAFAGVELAKGGFIGMNSGGVAENNNENDQGGMNIIEEMNPKFKKKLISFMNSDPRTRPQVSEFLDSLDDREALAVTIFSESVVQKDSPEALRAVGETVLNRVNDKTYSFKNLSNIKDVLRGRTTRGSGMFAYDGLEPTNLKPRLKDMLNNQDWQKALDAADMALDMSPDREKFKLRDDVFTYGKRGYASDKLNANLRNEYFTTIGDHDFYSRTPEKGGFISTETMGQPKEYYTQSPYKKPIPVRESVYQ